MTPPYPISSQLGRQLQPPAEYEVGRITTHNFYYLRSLSRVMLPVEGEKNILKLGNM